jgi:5-methyltetrahydropteroyltriglutamate--homocysteine methyltransferase
MSLRNLRVDQVGSLLRPHDLIEAFVSRGRDKIDDHSLQSLQDKAIEAVVSKQEALGLPIVSDGEYRRLNWQVSFSRVAGWDLWQRSWDLFLKNPGKDASEGEKAGERGADAVEVFKVSATRELSLLENFPLKEFNFLKSITETPSKIMIMGPDRVSQMCDVSNSHSPYRSREVFLEHVAKIQNQMVGELIQAGCKYIQIDEPSYTGYVDARSLGRIKEMGEDPEENLRRAVRATNSVVSGYQGLACFGVHICRGNRASMWHREGSYDPIAEYLFSELMFDRLLLEYDTDRAGSFDALRFVPKDGPVVVLGLITTKTDKVESVDDLLFRVEEAQRFIDIGQLAISPQCGFASGIGGNLLSEYAQWQKLEVMLEAAEKIWGA